MNLIRRRKKQKMGLRESAVIRCPAHLAFVRSHECLCSTKAHLCTAPTEAAHVRIGTDGGTSMKPSDCFCVPLCSDHHREQHSIGEASFAAKYRLNLLAFASTLWRTSPAGIRYRKAQEQPA
jgi:hypothetical protein